MNKMANAARTTLLGAVLALSLGCTFLESEPSASTAAAVQEEQTDEIKAPEKRSWENFTDFYNEEFNKINNTENFPQLKKYRNSFINELESRELNTLRYSHIAGRYSHIAGEEPLQLEILFYSYIKEGNHATIERIQKGLEHFTKKEEDLAYLASFILGALYYTKFVSTKNPGDLTRAKKWYEESEKGWPEWPEEQIENKRKIQFRLGGIYYVDKYKDCKKTKGGVCTEAEEWYNKAADISDRSKSDSITKKMAKHALGEMYYYGKGADKSRITAFELLFEAGGYRLFPRVQYELALMFFHDARSIIDKAINGIKVTPIQLRGAVQDLRQMAIWLQPAAEGDYPPGQNYLGQVYETNGDLTEAYKWYLVARKSLDRQEYMSDSDRMVLMKTIEKAKQRIENQIRMRDRTDYHLNKAQELADNWKPKIRIGSGTGFYIGKRQILTNKHVVSRCDEIRIFPGGESARSHDIFLDISLSRVVDLVPSRKPVEVDLALLADQESGPKPAEFREDGVQVGEDVIVIGYPLGHRFSPEPSVTKGIVSAISAIGGDRKRFRITAPIQRGNSGGPVLDVEGKVIGVTVSSLTGTQNLNFAINSQTVITAFPHVKQSKKPLSDESSSKPSSTEIAEIASKFTVLVECWKYYSEPA